MAAQRNPKLAITTLQSLQLLSCLLTSRILDQSCFWWGDAEIDSNVLLGSVRSWWNCFSSLPACHLPSCIYHKWALLCCDFSFVRLTFPLMKILLSLLKFKSENYLLSDLLTIERVARVKHVWDSFKVFQCNNERIRWLLGWFDVTLVAFDRGKSMKYHSLCS